MQLSEIFVKPIDRPIEGVIKADDEASLRVEVEEYVLTHEIERRMGEFLAGYTKYVGANGAWISGFFGSGKSHLLKMLALLLENRVVDGTPVLDLFLPKCEDDELLRAEIKRAVAIPSRSILFNIDQKADVISKTQADALLAVFVKVFDEMCGYYGKQGHIAQFERDLDSRGQYQAFQRAYREISGQDWTRGREQALLEAHNIALAYAQATGAPQSTADGIIEKYRATYKMSIEDFAELVADYIDRQEPNFRLNFFVDEVGQYIADNVKLMTNLQTLAESLATKCRGRAWILVTAQEDMSDVIGEMSKQQGNDFSKIRARFAYAMKLTSGNVAQVIRRRLLQKNEAGNHLLADMYAEQQNNFRTLFEFADGAKHYRTYRELEDFAESYPFVPYQYELFQAAIRALSEHNAFEGKHRSVGERSMLGVFQDVAKRIGGAQVGRLATFDLMYEGIGSTLKSQMTAGVQTAERNLDNPLAVGLLKALFLVKYVRDFKATPRNLTVLMLDGFDADITALRRRVEEALNLLEQQTYVQRTGDVYEYLTNEERDVEAEIKLTEVDTSAVADELAELVFDEVLRERKVRYDGNGQDYAFARKLDDRLIGREQELAIHVISPFHEHAGNEVVLRARAMGRDELLVILPPSDRLLRELLLYKRTDKYVRQNSSATQRETVKLILQTKAALNRTRRIDLKTLAAELLGQATLIVAGQEVDANSTDAQTRLVRGFHALIERTYPNLRMLPRLTYSESDIARHLLPLPEPLPGMGPADMDEAETNMLGFVQTNKGSGLRTTLQSLVNRFERKPYGWYLAAIQCTLAKLCARGKVEVWRDGTLVEGVDLERTLRNTHGFAQVLIDAQEEIDIRRVRQLKDFYSGFFDGPPQASEAKPLAQETAVAFARLEQEIVALERQASNYPFLAALDGPLARLRAVTGQAYTFYLNDLPGQADALLDLKEQVLDPVRRFMAGSLRQIYDEAHTFLQTQGPNLIYVDGEEARRLRAIVDDPACYNGNHMMQARALLTSLQGKVNAAVAQQRAAGLRAVEERWARLQAMAEYGELDAARQQQLRPEFDALKRTIESEPLIAVMSEQLSRFDEGKYLELLGTMAQWAAENKQVKEPKPVYVAYHTLPVTFNKPVLITDADVDEYLAALRQAMLAAIAENKRIQI